MELKSKIMNIVNYWVFTYQPFLVLLARDLWNQKEKDKACGEISESREVLFGFVFKIHLPRSHVKPAGLKFQERGEVERRGKFCVSPFHSHPSRAIFLGYRFQNNSPQRLSNANHCNLPFPFLNSPEEQDFATFLLFPPLERQGEEEINSTCPSLCLLLHQSFT